MSNILIFLDMSTKHVHLYPKIGFHIKDLSIQKVKTWNRSLNYIILIINHIINIWLLTRPDRKVRLQYIALGRST